MYGFSTTHQGSFDSVIEQVTNALKNEGFGVLTDIDVQATLKTKLGVEMPAYRILGACNPSFAKRSLEADPDLGLLLPCNVVVRQEASDTITVTFMDPAVVFEITGDESITRLGAEVREHLTRVQQALASSDT